MVARIRVALLVVLGMCGWCGALESDEVMVLANKDHADSMRLARYYCQKRGLPKGHVIEVGLGAELRDTIDRAEYDRVVVKAVRKAMAEQSVPGGVRCIVTTYGVPYKVGARGKLAGMDGRLSELRRQVERDKKLIEQYELDGEKDTRQSQQTQRRLAELRLEIKRITGGESGASFDSELSMAMYRPYELFRWQPNALRGNTMAMPSRTLMVSRLDGPSYAIAQGLIDKAMSAESNGLNGFAYIDSRGLTSRDTFGQYDQLLRDLAMYMQTQGPMQVRQEKTAELFAPGSCPQTAIYCGWYSLAKYIDAFDFVDGAIGYHIASFEGKDLRSEETGQWCSSMLRDGVTATIGPVAEPYLHSFAEPNVFFKQLFRGASLAEAYYRTKPFNSWQMMLIGDPMYRPFAR